MLVWAVVATAASGGVVVYTPYAGAGACTQQQQQQQQQQRQGGVCCSPSFLVKSPWGLRMQGAPRAPPNPSDGQVVWGETRDRAQRRSRGDTPLLPLRPLRPWENLEIFPLAQELADPEGPPDNSQVGPLESSNEGALSETDGIMGGGPQGPAAARLPKGEFR